MDFQKKILKKKKKKIKKKKFFVQDVKEQIIMLKNVMLLPFRME